METEISFRNHRIAQNGTVQVRFLLGPAGSGKTFRCLAEIRQQLSNAPDGMPLVLVTPKQATYELERQLLSNPSIQGYTRLHILSFERLADFIFERSGITPPELLSEEGRVMVLRALLSRKRKSLRLFRASARLTGFAQQLSSAISEFQQSRLAPGQLRELAARMTSQTLSLKLEDLAALTEQYLAWLEAHGLQDGERLLEAATECLGSSSRSPVQSLKLEAPSPESKEPFQLSLYVDGFAQFSETEIELLAALLPLCVQATITFCLPEGTAVDRADERNGRRSKIEERTSWLSGWSVARKAFESCRKRLAAIAGAELRSEYLGRDPEKNRFASSRALARLEKEWAEPCDSTYSPQSAEEAEGVPQQKEAVRIIECADQEGEVIFAAREILRFVRKGGRYGQVAVLVRDLKNYHSIFQRIFASYEIPLFLDRRQSVSHHPLAELTRSALRTIAFGWQHEDWFAALKTGLVPANEEEIDRLENEALARGWEGASWQTPLRIQEVGRTPQEKERLLTLETELERIRKKVLPAFQQLALTLKRAQNKPTGRDLVACIREFWAALRVPQHLEWWAAGGRWQTAAGPAEGALHETVWNEINSWLDNIELAFSDEPVALREWLPILEAGLANLTVGLIPPSLDQVLIGTVDRSRNPDIRLGLVLGMNETVFPAAPTPALLLTSTDRAELERHGVRLGLDPRQQLNRERYYAYIACTRPREQLLLTFATRAADGTVLNPSPFLFKIRQIFPALQVEVAPEACDLSECEHPHELLRRAEWGVANGDQSQIADSRGSARLPGITAWMERLKGFRSLAQDERLSADLAEQLYGSVLRTSVSRMEQFAACPFKFFVHSGLRAEERKRFELDVREQGTFQHDVLALFHEQLQRENKRWRDIGPAEARSRVADAAAALTAGFREGLLQSDEQTRFMARAMTESLQDFVEILVTWMNQQYRFDPVRVELPFGENEAQPAWTLDLGKDRQIQLYGRIDRVDLFHRPEADEALCVVIDYKSSQKQLDSVMLANGLQLQLLTYLNVLRNWPQPQLFFGTSRLIPAGVFYVSLRGKYSPEKNRTDALNETEQARKSAYRHAGRFDAAALPYLDSRTGPRKGDQFNFRVLEDERIHGSCREPLASDEFLKLLDSIKLRLVKMGKEIYAGVAALAPYRKGSSTACDQCAYQWICRIDPWTHRFRSLQLKPSDASVKEPA